jgi:uncharacterized damage-inducible protein DinB
VSLFEHFRAMAGNNLWSNYRLHTACAQLTTNEYFADRGAFFRSIHDTLNHILVVDRHYTAAIANAQIEQVSLDRELFSDLASLTAAQMEADRHLVRVCKGFSSQDLEAIAHWKDGQGGVHQDPISIVLTHLFLHQIHHRGQIHNMLSVMGHQPPQLDEYFLSQDASLRKADLKVLGIQEGDLA